MDWTRAELKARAKAQLKKNYGMLLAISLILAFVGGHSPLGAPSVVNLYNSISDLTEENPSGAAWRDIDGADDFLEYDGDIYDLPYYEDQGPLDALFNSPASEPFFAVALFLLLAGFVLLIGYLLFRIFIGYNLLVGCQKYFIENAAGRDARFALVGHSFKRPVFLNVVKTLFLRDLYIFLWSLLLFIPGIVMQYAYCMTEYILADNPSLPTKRAIELSKAMTYGERFNIFVLGLSFLGWYLLGCIPCGLGVFFVYPYEFATRAELYLVLREKAIRSGIATAEELNLTIEPEPQNLN